MSYVEQSEPFLNMGDHISFEWSNSSWSWEKIGNYDSNSLKLINSEGKLNVLDFQVAKELMKGQTLDLKNFRILSIHQKIKILEKLDVDFLITKKFNKQFSKIKSQNFIKEILYKKLKAKYIFVSNNFRFGNKREGDVNELIRNEKNYNYKIIKPKPFKLKNTIISSTLIRKLLSNGKIEFVNRLLSRNWSIESKVEKGRQLGKKIGFPTCNLNIKNYVIAKTGVYAVKIYQKNKNFSLKGIANLGYRPTFNQKKILLEVYIFNFSGNLYNKHLTIEFINFIRKEKKFKNINQLRKQINLDLKSAKKKLN